MGGSKRVRRLVAAVVVITAILVPASPASAKFTIGYSGGVLTVSGTPGDDDIRVWCVSGNVWVNNKAAAGPIACASVTKLRVQGAGGNDHLDAEDTPTIDFSSLTRTVLIGGPGRDFLISGPIPTTLLGGGAGDLLVPGAGSDKLRGGPGMDGTYLRVPDSITLTDTSAFGPSTGSDVLSGLEGIIVFADGTGPVTVDATSVTGAMDIMGFIGSPANDTYYGGYGRDLMLGGPGADHLDGGPGKFDEIDSEADTNQTLWDTALADGSGMVDTLVDVERATLRSGAPGNTLDASAFSGKVELIGAGGNDTLIGGPKADVLRGGPGTDTCSGNGGKDTIKGCEFVS